MKNFKKNIARVHASGILNSSILVAIFTALSFLGFFLRDFYITEHFGISEVSDTIFFVSVIPMFFVSIFCVPFGQASIPFLNKIKKSELQPATSYFFSISLFFCFILCFVSYVIYDLSFLVFGNYFFGTNIKLAILAFLPLLFLSGWLIFCNSILLTKEYYLLPNLAQLVVPVIALSCLLLFASSIGIYSVIFGMVLGQIVNLMIVTSALTKEKIFFKTITFKPPPSIKKNFWGSYAYLVVIAMFSSINILISTFIAKELGSGAISIFNLGIKFNLFICGLFTAIFSSVIFPSFSKALISKGSSNLNDQTSFLLIFFTIFLIPFSILIFNYSDAFTFLVFGQIIKEKSSLLGISSVFKYSVIQLPFWVYNAIILKHGSVINKVKILTLVCIIISSLNLIFSLFFIKFMNVGGLSFSMAVSNGIGSFILLFYYLKNKYISFSNAALMLSIWSFFIGFIILLNQEKFSIFVSNLLSII